MSPIETLHAERDVRARALPEAVPGSRRVTSVWMRPSSSVPHDPAGVAVPASAGRWTERSPGTFARVTVAVPVTVGSTLQLR